MELWINLVDLSATDTRDKVFGMLSLLDSKQAALIVPEYDHSYATVFSKATFASIANTSTLSALQYISLRPLKTASLPTWAVDFLHPDANTKLRSSYRIVGSNPVYGSGSGAEPTMSTDCRRLTLKGVQCERVQTVRRFPTALISPMLGGCLVAEFGETSLSSMKACMASAIAEMPSLYPYCALIRSEHAALNDGSSCLCQHIRPDISWSALQAAARSPELCSRQSEPTDTCFFSVAKLFRAWYKSLPHVDGLNDKPDLTAFVQSWFDYLDWLSESSAFITTAHGFIGMASGETQPGDTLALLRGSSAPAVLQRTEHGYTFKGLAYLNGLEDREFLEHHPADCLQETDFVLV